MSKIQGITYEPPVREEFKMPTLEEMMAMMGGGPGGPGGPGGGPGEGDPPGGPSTPKTPVALKENGKLIMGDLRRLPPLRAASVRTRPRRFISSPTIPMQAASPFPAMGRSTP